MQADKLFVYGTLLSAFEHPMGQYLKENALLLGRVHVHGYLFDVGEYPGLVPDHSLQNKVYGELFQLNDAAGALTMLDNYEETGESFSSPNEYRRELVPVFPENGTQFDAWVYFYQWTTEGLFEIKGGDYLTYLQNG